MHSDTRRIVTDLLRKIADAEYGRGDLIPTAEQLARVHGVPVSTADEALSRLIADGVLVLRPGVGATVAASRAGEDLDPDVLAVAKEKLDKDIAFLRDAIENPDTSVRWDPGASRS